ncbi:hypothetical protein PQX77_014177 [Marasmius sp. AFHP31]|nr:hypothetical protein PQX77_014177 [Marasmius sp. AFHP31]
MESSGDSQCSVPYPLRQLAESSDPAIAVSQMPPVYGGGRVILSDTLEHARNIVYSPIVGDLVAPPHQVVVSQQVQQVGLHPDVSDSIPTDSSGHWLRYGDYSSSPPPLSNLACVSPMNTRDPTNPVTFLHLQEDARRMLYRPPTVTIDNAWAAASSRRPAFHIVESRQVPLASEGVVRSMLGDPGHPTVQTRPFDHGVATNCNADTAASSIHDGPYGSIHLSQDLLPIIPNDFDSGSAHEVTPFPTGQAVADAQPPTMGPSLHIALPSDNTSGGYCQVVGSSLITQASMARRRGGARLYFCKVPGCTSQGFTARHNLRCKPVIHLVAKPLLTVHW